MKILVIGGTRFIGRTAVNDLVAQGHDVTVFNRGQTAGDLPTGVTQLTGDRREVGLDPAPLRAVHAETVIDMCCITAADAQWLIDTFNGHAGRVVLVSSMDVYRAYGRLIGTEPGELEPVPLTEDSPLRDKRYPYRGAEPRADDDPRKILDDYDKIPAEEIARGCAGLPGTVLRLPMVYGPWDYQHRLWPFIAAMTPEATEFELPRLQAAWRDCRGFSGDIATAIRLAATLPQAAGRVYNVGDPEDFTQADWAGHIAQAIGWSGRIVVTDAPESVEGDGETRFEQHLDTATTRIRRELGYVEALPLSERLRLTVEWERANPPPAAG